MTEGHRLSANSPLKIHIGCSRASEVVTTLAYITLYRGSQAMRGPPVSIETIINMLHKAQSNIPGYSTSRHPEQVLISHISTKANSEVPITCGILITNLVYTHPSMTIIHVSQHHHHLGMSSNTQDCTKEYQCNVTAQGSSNS